MMTGFTRWLWLREFEIAEARTGHIAARRHLRVGLSSLLLAALVAIRRLCGCRP